MYTVRVKKSDFPAGVRSKCLIFAVLVPFSHSRHKCRLAILRAQSAPYLWSLHTETLHSFPLRLTKQPYYACTMVSLTTPALWSALLRLHYGLPYYACTMVSLTTPALWSALLRLHYGLPYYACTMVWRQA